MTFDTAMTRGRVPDHGGAGSVPELASGGLGNLEPLYSVAEVASYLKIDPSTCRRLFLDRRDVVRLGEPKAHDGKRQYCNLRIPLSVLEKFIRERSR